MTDQEKRNIALARTLLFNYGQGINTPHSNYLSLCKLLGVSPGLQSLPSFKEVPFPWSFFSKHLYNDQSPCQHMMLFGWREKEQFLSQGSAQKLNWMRNFYWAQELLFNFSVEDIFLVFKLLREEKRPPYKINSLPFQVSYHEPI